MAKYCARHRRGSCRSIFYVRILVRQTEADRVPPAKKVESFAPSVTQAPQGVYSYDPDSARVIRVRKLLLNFLKKRIQDPNLLGLNKQDHLFKIAKAFYEVGNKERGVIVYRTSLAKEPIAVAP